jgi:hypothetical protein
MERPGSNETILKTFNTAKLFAEGILFPRMKLFQDFQTQADFGSMNMNIAQDMTEEIRDLQRYNGLKGMCETVYNLLLNISSTVRLKGSKEEIKQLDDLIKYINNLKKSFYENKDKFFIQTFKSNHIVETIDRIYFEKIKENINICYINCEILMTKNKLLFSDEKDDYITDKEMLEELKREYVEG